MMKLWNWLKPQPTQSTVVDRHVCLEELPVELLVMLFTVGLLDINDLKSLVYTCKQLWAKRRAIFEGAFKVCPDYRVKVFVWTTGLSEEEVKFKSLMGRCYKTIMCSTALGYINVGRAHWVNMKFKGREIFEFVDYLRANRSLFYRLGLHHCRFRIAIDAEGLTSLPALAFAHSVTVFNNGHLRDIAGLWGVKEVKLCRVSDKLDFSPLNGACLVDIVSVDWSRVPTSLKSIRVTKLRFTGCESMTYFSGAFDVATLVLEKNYSLRWVVDVQVREDIRLIDNVVLSVVNAVSGSGSLFVNTSYDLDAVTNVTRFHSVYLCGTNKLTRLDLHDRPHLYVTGLMEQVSDTVLATSGGSVLHVRATLPSINPTQWGHHYLPYLRTHFESVRMHKW